MVFEVTEFEIASCETITRCSWLEHLDDADNCLFYTRVSKVDKNIEIAELQARIHFATMIRKSFFFFSSDFKSMFA